MLSVNRNVQPQTRDYCIHLIQSILMYEVYSLIDVINGVFFSTDNLYNKFKKILFFLLFRLIVISFHLFSYLRLFLFEDIHLDFLAS